MSLNPRSYRKGVAEVVYRMKDGKIEYLLLYSPRHGRGWKLLKGSHRNMAEKDVLEKELDEETKLEAKKVQKVPARIKYEFPNWRQRGYSTIGQDMQVYAVEVKPMAQVQLDFRENFDHYWTRFEEAKKLLRFESHKKALEKTDEFIRKQIEKERKL